MCPGPNFRRQDLRTNLVCIEDHAPLIWANHIDLRVLERLVLRSRTGVKSSMLVTGFATCSKICCKEGHKLLYFPARIAVSLWASPAKAGTYNSTPSLLGSLCLSLCTSSR